MRESDKMNRTERVLWLYKLLRKQPEDEALSYNMVLNELEDSFLVDDPKKAFPIRIYTDDINLLEKMNLAKRTKRKGTPKSKRGVYGLFDDDYFELWEIKILADAVSQISHLTPSSVNAIKHKLLNLTSKNIRDDAKNVLTDLPDEIYSHDERFVKNLRIVLSAITSRKVLKCDYAHLGADKNYQDEGDVRTIHPYALTIKQQSFFVVGYHEEKKAMWPSRVDRIFNPVITEIDRMPPSKVVVDGKTTDYTKKIRGYVRNNTSNFFSEKTTYVKIKWHPEVSPMHVLFSIMGENNILPTKEEHVYNIKTADNDGLIANLLRLGSAVELLGERREGNVVDRYLKKVKAIADYYK